MFVHQGAQWNVFGYNTFIILTILYPVSLSLITDCTKEKDPLCNSRGACQSVAGTYSCKCHPDWTGTHCETNITSSPACMPGYKGVGCNTTMCGHGNVGNNQTYYKCYCDRGWNHNSPNGSCNDDYDECAAFAGICKNNGTCINTPGSYSCNCTSPWAGQNCTCNGSCEKQPLDHDDGDPTDITPIIIGCVIGALLLGVLIGAVIYINKRSGGKDEATNDNVFNKRFQRRPPDAPPEADDNNITSNTTPHNQINIKEASTKNILH